MPRQHCASFPDTAQEKSQANIEQKDKTVRNILSQLDNIAQGFYLCIVVPKVLRQHWTGFFPI